MKLKILLLILFSAGILNAQVVCDYPEAVITTLIISEARMTGYSHGDAYLEITNLGETPVNLSNFKFGTLDQWSNSAPIFDICNDPWYHNQHKYIFLPDRVLEPGKSFVITNAYDYSPRHFKEGIGRLGGSERPKQVGIYEVADKLIHIPEPILGITYEGDSVTTAINDPENYRNRGNYPLVFTVLPLATFYLEHHYAEGDSAVVDQVGGVFDGGDGRNQRTDVAYSIAGVEEATKTFILVRKANVTKGNLDFANARGLSMEDSEWIPIPLPSGNNPWRDIFWTIGNHGNFQLNENTLEPETDAISVDYTGKKITVPWGIRRLDDIMRNMKKKPGVAWNYHLNPLREDSLFHSARNGDQLTVYVVGNTLQTATFDIMVNEPTADDNIVVPIDHPILYEPGLTGPITTSMQNGILGWPRVTSHESGTDTITGSGFGLAFDLRTDTLLKYLEKPPKASWEFVWVDEVPRPDVKNGDKLKITSENGKVKEYFIQVQTHFPNRDATLAAITWPDIPDFYRGIFGWKGDTIPNFSPGMTNYSLKIPLDVEGVPALKAKTRNVNSKVKVIRARSLSGSIQDRTITFEVTAEDDTVKNMYKVVLEKEKHPLNVEPFHGDPFISTHVVNYPGGVNFVTLFNPGNQPLDLRNYMMGLTNSADPYTVITNWGATWERRYTVYIPGMKHVDEASWPVAQRFMVTDPNVNSIIPPGGTFVMAHIQRGDNFYPGISNYWPSWDVQFMNNAAPGIGNPWGEHVHQLSTPVTNVGARRYTMILFKILNDSIKLGLKRVSDRNDFEIIDTFGRPDGQNWGSIGSYTFTFGQNGFICVRKPEITKGNPVMGESFGTNDDDTEWKLIWPNNEFAFLPLPERYGAAYGVVENHNFLEPTFYKSTVNSSLYKVSDGFGPDEEIFGLKGGTTVTEFLSLINKEDEGQNLKVVAAANGSELAMDAVIGMNYKLIVVSADSLNTTLYRLDVTEAGLSNDAYLTSARWSINVSVEPKSAGEASAGDDGVGSVSGFDYGTTLKTIVDNVTVPAGATLTVIDGSGAYMPFTALNFDTAYVSVTVNPDSYLDVLAEDKVTRIVYQLQPNTSASDAFILSDMYMVSQLENLIHFVPRGTNFDTFLSNITPSLGASLKLIDKMGFERRQGNIREDDKVVVTSANGENTRVYFISFLPTSLIPQTTYLAYVLSNAYSVNQVDYVISEGLAPLTGQTLLGEFLSNITPSMGAKVVVVDINGIEKTIGDLDDGDMLKVTSADGKIVTMYHLALDLTSADRIGVQQQIEIYPNPTTGRLNISGVEAGNRIRIYSATGALIRDRKALSNLEMVSLDDVPSGMFLIVISNDNQLLGRYKAIKSHSK